MMGDWTFFSNYGHVLVCLAKNNEARLRDVATDVGITERAAQKIVKDMQDAGFLTVTKHGRRNRYQINKRKSLRHGLESHCNIGKVLALITKPDPITRPRKVKVQASEVDSPAKPAPAAVAEEVKTRYPSVADEETAPVEENKKADKASKVTVADTREQGSLF